MGESLHLFVVELMSDNKVSPIKKVAKHMKDVLFRREDSLLKEILPTTGDDDLVHIMDSLDQDERLRLFRTLPQERRAKILNEMAEYSATNILSAVTHEEIVLMIESEESDAAVDIIQQLEDVKKARVIADLRKHDPNGLLPLLVFDEETAGGRMKTEIIKVFATESVKDVRDTLGKEKTGKLKTHFIYVVNKHDFLVGHLSPLRLIQGEADVLMSDIMLSNTRSLPVGMDQEEVAQVFDEQDAIELPVVNSSGKLLGAITADDIFEVLEEEYAKDVQALAGVHEDANINDPVLVSAKRRIPWLGVNLITATVAATVITFFQDTIEKTVILAAIMPVIAGIGGNAAQQALAVTVRAMATGDIHTLNKFRTIGKEVLVGTLNGFIAGSVMGALIYFWTHNVVLSLVVMVSMTMNLFMAGLVGVGIPVTMKWLKKDPAISSTVFVTATTDIFGFFLFLSLATILL